MSIPSSHRERGSSVKQILKRLCPSPPSLIIIFRGRLSDTSKEPTLEDQELSSGRRALQTTIVGLDVAVSIAETVPVFGPSIKGALEAVWKALNLIEQRHRNADDVAKLAERLTALMKALGSIDAPGDVLLLQLLKGLQSIESQLNRVLSKQWVRAQAVAQVLTGCGNDINACLQDFMAITLASMRIRDSERVTTECVTVLDPFGFSQKMLRVDMGSIEVVAMTILSRYKVNPTMQEALQRYIIAKKYDMTIDDGQQIQMLQGALESSIDRGATVVMNVIMDSEADEGHGVRCPKCQSIIASSRDSRASCATCGGRVTSLHTPDHRTDLRAQSLTPYFGVALFQHITVSPYRRSNLYRGAPMQSDGLASPLTIDGDGGRVHLLGMYPRPRSEGGIVKLATSLSHDGKPVRRPAGRSR